MESAQRVLLVAYEFAEPLFSGNGTYGRTLVEGLLRLGEKGGVGAIWVDVVTAVPVIGEDRSDSCSDLELLPQTSALRGHPQLSVLPVPVNAAKWRRHDLNCDWVGFAAESVRRYGDTVQTRLRQHSHAAAPSSDQNTRPYYHTIAAVDWHGFYALQALVGGPAALAALTVPTVFLNFRVFANPLLFSVGSLAEGISGPVNVDVMSDAGESAARCEFDMFLVVESAAVLLSSRVVVLSSADRSMLRDNLTRFIGSRRLHSAAQELLLYFLPPSVAAPLMSGSCGDVCNNERCVVVPPPVRVEVLEASRTLEAVGEGAFEALHLPLRLQRIDPSTRFLVCCVRVVPDKNPQRFVELCERLMARGVLSPAITPLIFGAAPDAAFAAELRARLLTCCPWAISLEEFVSPLQLVAIFSRSILNVHPCVYDAYGLTVAEAAVCGCPSFLHVPHQDVTSPIGVADLLFSPSPGRIFSQSLLRRVNGRPAAPTAIVADVTDDEEFFTVVAKFLCLEAQDTRAEIGNAARAAAVAFDTDACGALLFSSAFQSS